MAYRKYIPPRDNEFAPWSSNFTAQLTSSPGHFGVTAAQVAALPPLQTAFAAAFAVALDPVTRTQSAVLTKNLARTALEAEIRRLVRLLRGVPITEPQLRDLGLPVPAPRRVSPEPAPDHRPALSLLSFHHRTHTLRLADAATQSRRARPADTAGAMLFYTTTPGSSPYPDEANMDHWRFAGLATRTRTTLNYPPTEAGKTAVIVARWYNRKGELGPFSDPLYAIIAA